MRKAALAEFPDAVTSAGAKHLVELSDMVAAGARAVMLFLVQIARRSASRRPPTSTRLGLAFDAARAAGVEVLVRRCGWPGWHRVADAIPLVG